MQRRRKWWRGVACVITDQNEVLGLRKVWKLICQDSFPLELTTRNWMLTYVLLSYSRQSWKKWIKIKESDNTGKCNKLFQSIPLLVHLPQGYKEANLKAMYSDRETAGNGSDLIWSNQELKGYFEWEVLSSCETEWWQLRISANTVSSDSSQYALTHPAPCKVIRTHCGWSF